MPWAQLCTLERLLMIRERGTDQKCIYQQMNGTVQWNVIGRDLGQMQRDEVV